MKNLKLVFFSFIFCIPQFTFGNWGSKIPTDIGATCFKSSANTYYFFKGNQYWEKKVGKAVSGPKSIRSGWGTNMPTNIDAACFKSSANTYYFFKGNQYWEKKVGKAVSGPKSIRNGWGTNMPTNIDAACFKSSANIYYFFKGNQYWEKKVGKAVSSPKSIRNGWGANMSINIDAACFKSSANIYYFFKGNQYWEKKVGKAVSNPKFINLSKWMSSINDNISIAALSIPGTHDSGADYGAALPSSPIHIPIPLANSYTKTQSKSIKKQLNAGIRYLDIRCKKVGNVFRIHHAVFYQNKTFEDILKDCKKFLEANQQETILMRLKGEDQSNKLDKSIFKKYQNKYPNIWYEGTTIPTIGEVRGKIVIIDLASLGKGIPWKDIDNQDKYDPKVHKNNMHKKWSFVYNHLEKSMKNSSNNKIFANHLSAAGTTTDFRNFNDLLLMVPRPPTPKDFAEYCLPKAQQYLDSRAGRFGVIIMDFPTQKICNSIIQTNFLFEGNRDL